MRISIQSCALGLALLVTTTLGACTRPPSAAEMAGVPVVTYGTAAPGKDFVLHYKAGQPMPVAASVRGTLIARPVDQTLMVATSRDIWLYKDWASFDGKTWRSAHDLVTNEFKVLLPGFATGQEIGELSAKFDAK